MNLKSLKPVQVKAAILMAQGYNCRAAAKAVSVTPQTISEWQRLPEFGLLVEYLKMEALNGARDKIRALAGTAATTLKTLLCEAKAEEVRRKVAMDVLEMVGIRNPSTGLYGWGIDIVNSRPSTVQFERANASGADEGGVGDER